MPSARSAVNTIACCTLPTGWSSADEYPGSSFCDFQISEPSVLRNATIDAPRPPGDTRIRSFNTSGDSLNPQLMLEPPYFWRRFWVQNTLPLAASSTVMSPLDPNT